MALETKYRPTFKGAFLDADGNRIDNISDAVEFDTLAEVNTFLETSGSLGEYHIRTYAIKSE